MKRFLCALTSCLSVAAISVAADDVIEIQQDGTVKLVQIQGGKIKLVPVNKDDKIDKDKIVGTWESKKLAKGLGLPNFVAWTWDFDKDGTLEVSHELILNPHGNGKFKVDGNKLTITLKLSGEKEKEVIHKTTITKLTDKELQTKDEKGNVCEFTKKTDK